jgi:DNA-binding transcriptional ArsR family regulator
VKKAVDVAAPETVLAFAKATIEGEMVRLIDEDNRTIGTASLQDVVYEGVAFMGDPRPGRLVFDVDAATNPETWAPAGRAALEALGCAVVRVSSGYPGSEHWWFVGPPGWNTSAMRDVALGAGVPAGQLRWGGRDCRPPLSPHRLGYPVELLEPLDAEVALALLSRRPGALGFDQERWASVIETGDTEDRAYEGKSWKAVHALAVAVVNAGEDQPFFRMLLDSSPVFSRKIAAMGGKADAWITSRWERAERFVRDHPPEGFVDSALRNLSRTLACYPWRGRSGQTDRLVFRRLIEIARAAHRLEIGQSLRTLERDLGLTRKTIAAALRRLGEAGLVTRSHAGSADQSATYLLRPKTDLCYPNELLPAPCKEKVIGVVEGTLPVPDAFRGRRGLPRSAYETWVSLDAERWSTVADLAAARGGPGMAKTIRHHLRLLEDAGLAERNAPRGHGWRRTAADEERLHAVASERGSSGHLARVTALHGRDREVRDSALAASLAGRAA